LPGEQRLRGAKPIHQRLALRDVIEGAERIDSHENRSGDEGSQCYCVGERRDLCECLEDSPRTDAG
jgi:hypothetical protein